jgi:hypothetical protein
MRQDDYPPRLRSHADWVGSHPSTVTTSDHRAASIRVLVATLARKARQFVHAYQSDRSARTIIYVIVAVNCCLIGIDIFLKFMSYFGHYHYHPDFQVTVEGGYPELFNYLQLTVVAWLMLHVFVRTRQAVYAASGIIFLIALAEDALGLHERVGVYAAEIDIPAPSLLGAPHFAELLHFLVVGALFIVLLVYGLAASSAEDRKIGALFTLLIFILGFFVAVVDAVHIMLIGVFAGSHFLLGVIEDGGEMLTVAVALSAALLLFRHLDDLRRPSRSVPK